MSGNKEKYRLWRHANGIVYVLWTEHVEVPGGDRHPQTRRISTGSTDWHAAEQFRAQFIAGLNNATPVGEPTIAYLLDRYRNEHAVNTRSLESIDYSIATLKPFFGMLLPSHVTNVLLRQFAQLHKKSSPGTVLRRLGVLKAALRYAEGNRWIAPLPVFRMPVSHPAPRDIWLTRGQVDTLIANAKSPHIELFIKLAISTAARSGALVDLKWSQVDLENRQIDFGKGWGNKRRSVVPINDDAYEALLVAQTLALSDYVIEFRGQRVESIKTAFRRLSKDCKIECSPHVLRHTAATWLVMAGVPIAEVARLLGNSEAIAERVYGKHSPDYLQRAVSFLNYRRPKNDLSHP